MGCTAGWRRRRRAVPSELGGSAANRSPAQRVTRLGQAEPRGVLGGDLDGDRRDVGRRARAAPGTPDAIDERDAAGAGAQVGDERLAARGRCAASTAGSTASTSTSVSGRGMSTPGRTLTHEVAEGDLAGDVLERLAGRAALRRPRAASRARRRRAGGRGRRRARRGTAPSPPTAATRRCGAGARRPSRRGRSAVQSSAALTRPDLLGGHRVPPAG